MREKQISPDRIERDIDDALSMLGRIDPPRGQVERIQMRLQMSAGVSEKRRMPGMWLPVSCAALTAIVLAVFLLPHLKRTASSRTHTVASASTSLHTANANAGTAEELVPSAVEAATSRVVRPVRRAHRHRVAKNPLDYPLTGQERLLILFVQNAKPADLQILNRAYQAKVEAQQDAEFAAYVQSGDSASSSGSAQATTQE